METYDGIPVERRDVPCRHGDGGPAVARYETPEGCACFPGDRVQDLCAQHIVKDGMIGEAKIILVYHPECLHRLFGRSGPVSDHLKDSAA